MNTVDDYVGSTDGMTAARGLRHGEETCFPFFEESRVPQDPRVYRRAKHKLYRGS